MKNREKVESKRSKKGPNFTRVEHAQIKGRCFFIETISETQLTPSTESANTREELPSDPETKETSQPQTDKYQLYHTPCKLKVATSKNRI